MLHFAICGPLLAVVRLPAVTPQPSDQSVALAFIPSRPISPAPPDQQGPAETPTPPDMPDQPDPAEIATPPDQFGPADIAEPPKVPVSEPKVPPPVPAVETKSSDMPPPVTRPPAVHSRTVRAKPVLPPHIAATQATSQPHPSEAQSGQPSSRPPFTQAPVASDWQRSLTAWLAAHKTYPEEARRRGTEGNVVLRLTVDRSGRVLNVLPVRSAGSPLLDNAAEAIVRDAALPPFTDGMSQDTVTITVQIHYALEN